MGLIDDVQTELGRDELEDSWREMINTTVDDEELQAELLDWIRSTRNEFIGLTEDVGDEEEVRTSIILRYVEYKCHWMTLNTRMQYQAVNTGQPDPKIMTKGGLMSNLLEQLEQFLDEDEVSKVTEFLSKPVEKLSGDELA